MYGGNMLASIAGASTVRPSDTNTGAKSMIGGALSGAAAGLQFGGPVGAGIGAVLGGLLSLF